MTFFHFINCVALAYLPYVLIYKFCGLSEYSAFWKCVQAGGLYLFTQLCKMMILATFFPERDAVSIDVLGEFLKCTMEIMDLMGIYFGVMRIAGKGEMKFMIAGMGWAFAELVMTRFIPLWVGARGIEFDWKYMQLSLESNIQLMNHLSISALVWMWTRHDLSLNMSHSVLATMVMYCYRPVFLELLTFFLGLSILSILAVKFVLGISLSLFTSYMYITLTKPANGAAYDS